MKASIASYIPPADSEFTTREQTKPTRLEGHWFPRSLVPRPPVFDRWKRSKTGGVEGLGTRLAI